MICITIDNDSNIAIGGSCYSAHQSVSRFGEDHIDIVSFAHRAGVSEHINKSLECVL